MLSKPLLRGLPLFCHSVVSDSFATSWTAACQAPFSMGFPRQESWSGLPFPPPGALPDPGIKLLSPVLTGGFFTTAPPGRPFPELKALPAAVTLNMTEGWARRVTAAVTLNMTEGWARRVTVRFSAASLNAQPLKQGSHTVLSVQLSKPANYRACVVIASLSGLFIDMCSTPYVTYTCIVTLSFVGLAAELAQSSR